MHISKQEDVADSGLVLDCSALQKHLQSYGPRGRVVRGKALLTPVTEAFK